MTDVETFEAAFTSSPGTNLAGIPVGHLDLPGPSISYGLPYQTACQKHVKQTYNASKVYIIASASLSRDTDKLNVLIEAIGQENIVGVRKGMASHSLWSEIIEVTNEARSKDTDCIVTLGAGSLTDAAKLVTFVCTAVVTTNQQTPTNSIFPSPSPTTSPPPHNSRSTP